MLGNAGAYRLHPVSAKSTPDAKLQLIKTIKKTKNLKHKPNYTHTLICTIIYSSSKFKTKYKNTKCLP